MGFDAASVGLAYFATEYSERTHRNDRERVERLGTAAIAVLILIAAVQLIGQGINRILHPQAIRGELVGMTAFIGLGVNLVCIVIYRKVEGGAMIRLSRAHLVGDTLNSVAVILSGVAMAWRHWYWLDGLTAVGIGFYLLGQIFLRKDRERH